MFSFFLPDWRYNHTGKHRSSILYLCWSWLVNDFVFNVQPASRCTARTSFPHVIFFNLNRERMTGCTILFQISKWDFLCKTATKAPFLLLCSGGPGLRVSSWAPSAAWFEYCTDVHVPQGLKVSSDFCSCTCGRSKSFNYPVKYLNVHLMSCLFILHG